MSRRCARPIEALPFESPKLSATAVFPSGEDFASRLERAIIRSGASLIEHQPKRGGQMKFRTGRRALRTLADMIDENAGLDPKAPAHNGPPLLLVSDRVLSWEWESLDRRKSRSPRDRLGPLTPWKPKRRPR
jgi:hypothetical protein